MCIFSFKFFYTLFFFFYKTGGGFFYNIKNSTHSNISHPSIHLSVHTYDPSSSILNINTFLCKFICCHCCFIIIVFCFIQNVCKQTTTNQIETNKHTNPDSIIELQPSVVVNVCAYYSHVDCIRISKVRLCW